MAFRPDGLGHNFSWHSFLKDAGIRDPYVQKYVDILTKANVDEKRLPTLNSEFLGSIGIKSIGHQIRILKKINRKSAPANSGSILSRGRINIGKPKKKHPRMGGPMPTVPGNKYSFSFDGKSAQRYGKVNWRKGVTSRSMFALLPSYALGGTSTAQAQSPRTRRASLAGGERRAQSRVLTVPSAKAPSSTDTSSSSGLFSSALSGI